MGLGSWIGGQFIDIIEWTEPSQNEILSYRFTRHKNEIKNGAKLIKPLLIITSLGLAVRLMADPTHPLRLWLGW